MAKIIINKEGFSKILSALSNGFPAKKILGTDFLFKLEINDNNCVVSVINAKVQMKSSITCQSDESGVIICVDHHIMMEMVRNFPDGDITITTEVNSDKAVKAINMKPEGQRKKYRISCSLASDFPHMIEIDDTAIFAEFDVQAKYFSDLMKTMASNVDSNNTVPCFANIVGYSLGGKLTFISGNNHLLSIHQTEVDINSQFIMPREISKYVAHMDGIDKCTLILSGNRMFITYSGFEMSLSLIDGTISNYKALIDTEPLKNKLLYPKKDLVDALSRLSIFTDETERIIMSVEGIDCDMNAVNEDFGNEGSEVMCIANEEDVKVKFGLKHSVMRKVCSNIPTDNVEIRISDRLAFFRADARKDILWMTGLSVI